MGAERRRSAIPPLRTCERILPPPIPISIAFRLPNNARSIRGRLQRDQSGPAPISDMRAHSTTAYSNFRSMSLFRRRVPKLAAGRNGEEGPSSFAAIRVHSTATYSNFVPLPRAFVDTLAAECRWRGSVLPPLRAFGPILPHHVTIRISMHLLGPF